MYVSDIVTVPQPDLSGYWLGAQVSWVVAAVACVATIVTLALTFTSSPNIRRTVIMTVVVCATVMTVGVVAALALEESAVRARGSVEDALAQQYGLTSVVLQRGTIGTYEGTAKDGSLVLCSVTEVVYGHYEEARKYNVKCAPAR